ncbi:DNA topoisomerase 2-binding-like protein, partial [Trifolium medium]|nr:DNA topoisomerase 2-binding-like protein [Trifolium medium]
ADVCRVSQFPTQAVRTINDMLSQFPSQPQSLRNTAKKNVDSGVENDGTHSKDNMLKDATEEAHAVTDIASEIEALVEMIDKVNMLIC